MSAVYSLALLNRLVALRGYYEESGNVLAADEFLLGHPGTLEN